MRNLLLIINFIKEVAIFLLLFLIVFSLTLVIFKGGFLFEQIKYIFNSSGSSAVSLLDLCKKNPGKSEICQNNNLFQKIPQRLVIPALNINAPIVLPEDTTELSLQLAFEKGVVLWPSSDLAGEKGTMIILGHSSAYRWYRGNYGSIFSSLNKLNIGDEIQIFTPEKVYHYRVVEKEIELPENLNIKKETNQSVLYLLSCWPIKTTWKRIAIKALSS